MNELERCPFCRGEARLHFRKKFEAEMIFEDESIISCRNCGAEILRYGHSYEAVESLVNMWNTRVSGWISVNDGLPEDDIMDAEIITKYVTRWQPLPEPIKEK